MMKVISAPEILSGFLCESPIDELAALTHCGEALANPGAELPPHRHSGFEFLYLVRGSIPWKIGKTLADQKMGDLFVTYPRELHGTDGKFREHTYNFWIGLELEKLGPEAIRLAKLLREGNVRLLHDCHDMKPILSAIVAAVVTPLPGQKQVIQAYLNVFYTLIEQRMKMSASPKTASAAKTHLPYSYSVQKAISYMERNMDRRLSLSELAKAATMRNKSYFGFRFRLEVGVTPAAYHLQMRLDATQSGLLQPSMDITSVALEYGFSSSQHFSAVFRQAFGVTPLAWKKSHAG